jgi:PTS system galactitol-specific IIA component
VANPGEQMEELQRILTIIQDTDILTNITQAGDVQNVIDIIKEKERSL